jgi:[ribosomal protein S5]-alanine N-acetyltransferase
MADKINFLPFPTITTDRLILRSLKDSDEQAVYSLRSNNMINKYLDRPKMKNINEAKDFIKKINTGLKLNGWFYWVISRKENAELMGTICLWNFSDDKKTAEIGYELMLPFQRKGFADEALKNIISYGFNKIGLEKIEAYTHKENISSIRLLERNNFELNPDRHGQHNADNLIYSLYR